MFTDDTELLKKAIAAQLPEIEGTEKIVDIMFNPGYDGRYDVFVGLRFKVDAKNIREVADKSADIIHRFTSHNQVRLELETFEKEE